MKQPFICFHDLLGAGGQIHMRLWIEIGGVRPFIFLYVRYVFSPACFRNMNVIDGLEKTIWHVINPKFNRKRNKINAEAQVEAHAEVAEALNSESKLVECICGGERRKTKTDNTKAYTATVLVYFLAYQIGLRSPPHIFFSSSCLHAPGLPGRQSVVY